MRAAFRSNLETRRPYRWQPGSAASDKSSASRTRGAALSIPGSSSYSLVASMPRSFKPSALLGELSPVHGGTIGEEALVSALDRLERMGSSAHVLVKMIGEEIASKRNVRAQMASILLG